MQRASAGRLASFRPESHRSKSAARLHRDRGKVRERAIAKGIGGWTNQMDDTWVGKRLQDKVGPEQAREIRRAMDEGRVEKWLIRVVNEDGGTKITKINELDSPIRGVKGKVADF